MYIFEFRKKGVSIFCMSSDNQSKSSVSYRATFMGTCLSDHVIASSLFVRMQDSWHHGWLHANVSVREPSKGWFPYDHCDRYQKVELSLPLQVSIWSLRSRSREDLEQTATYCILVYFSSKRSPQSLESGFHMIATIAELFFSDRSDRTKAGFHMIATIATKKAERSLRLWSLSSFHIGWFPCDCCDR